MRTRHDVLTIASILMVIILCCTALCIDTDIPDEEVGDSSEASASASYPQSSVADRDLPPAPPGPVRLIFIHHSCGENWLADWNGDLGTALMSNNYVVSDINYGWGPGVGEEHTPLGDLTDLGHWWIWFQGPQSAEYMDLVYRETSQHSEYSRLEGNFGGENEIIMFKSCFPNSNLQGNPGDPIPSIGANPLKGEGSWSEYHTVANAKGIYLDLLGYFASRQDKLFVVVTAPPVSDRTYAANARAFNQWLVNDWLDGYPYDNVAVFDFYNVLTSNGGNTHTNDLGSENGNHHRWWQGSIQHQVQSRRDVTAYASGLGDDHPTDAGNQKATAEFVPFLNYHYQQWKAAGK